MLRPGIGGGLKPITTPSRKLALSAREGGSEVARVEPRVGALRPVLQGNEGNARIGLLRAGQQVEAGDRDDVPDRRVLHRAFRDLRGDVERAVERRGWRQHRHQEDGALVLGRHEAARHALEQPPGARRASAAMSASADERVPQEEGSTAGEAGASASRSRD